MTVLQLAAPFQLEISIRLVPAAPNASSPPAAPAAPTVPAPLPHREAAPPPAAAPELPSRIATLVPMLKIGKNGLPPRSDLLLAALVTIAERPLLKSRGVADIVRECLGLQVPTDTVMRGVKSELSAKKLTRGPKGEELLRTLGKPGDPAVWELTPAGLTWLDRLLTERGV